MTIQLSQISEDVGGSLVGDSQTVITGANPPSEAMAGEITMLDDARRVECVQQSAASAVVTPEQVEIDRPQIVVSNPHAAFAKIVAHFRPPIDDHMPGIGIDPTAKVDSTALVHPTATIGAGVTVGPRTLVMPGVVMMPKCQVGGDCVIHANVTLYEYTVIDDRVVIHAGTVIGANGFGYQSETGKHLPTAQLGYVHVESDVELGAAVTIDRGTYGATRIGEGTKIDNQVMIGHNCRIGRHNLLCSQVGIAGSCQTGDHVVLAGQVGLKDHIVLGDRAIVGAQAGVMDDCAADQVYLGSPATPQREQMQIMAVERRLPEMRRELKQVRRELDLLQRQASASDSSKPGQHDQREDPRAA